MVRCRIILVTTIIGIVLSSCVSCKICEKKCPIGLVTYDYKGDILSHPDCIQCSKCVTACTRKAIGYGKIKI